MYCAAHYYWIVLDCEEHKPFDQHLIALGLMVFGHFKV